MRNIPDCGKILRRVFGSAIIHRQLQLEDLNAQSRPLSGRSNRDLRRGIGHPIHNWVASVDASLGYCDGIFNFSCERSATPSRNEAGPFRNPVASYSICQVYRWVPENADQEEADEIDLDPDSDEADDFAECLGRYE